LNFRGIETWLLKVFRMDRAVSDDIDPAVRARFESLGRRIFPCPATFETPRIVRNLARILQERGPYGIPHSICTGATGTWP
jgi:hypothetical protein